MLARSRYILSLRRSVPFQIDGKFFRTPTATPLLALPEKPQVTAGTLPHRPVDLQLALATPRPGEIVTYAASAMVVAQGTAVLSDAVVFAEYTPEGDNIEPALNLAVVPLPPRTSARFRDHRDSLQITWRRQHQTVLKPDAIGLVVALHSPEIRKETAPGEPVWLHVIAPDAMRGQRLYAVLAPDATPAGPVTLRVELANGETIERKGERFALLLASSLATDPGGLAGQNLRFTLIAARAGSWTLSILRDVTVPTQPVDRVQLLDPKALPPWATAAALLQEKFAIGRTAVSRAAKPLPALLGLIRHGPAPEDRRLVAFGPDTRGWEPLGDGSALSWTKSGAFVDTVPVGAAQRWSYELVMLHGDGSTQQLRAMSAG